MTRPLNWAWVWRSLRLRKWHLVRLLLLMLGVYGVGLILPIFTQRAVDSIGAGVVGPQLAWLAGGATISIVAEVSLISLRERLVIRLSSFLEERFSRKAFIQLMRKRIDSKTIPSGDILNCFQQAEKIPIFVLRLLPHFIFDAGNAFISLLLMIYYDVLIGMIVLIVSILSGIVMRNRLGQVTAMSNNNFRAYGIRQGILSESVAGLVTIKSLSIEGERVKLWDNATSILIDGSQKILDQIRRFDIAAGVVGHAVNMIVVFFGCYGIVYRKLTFGELLALQLLAGRLIAPILSVGDVFRRYQEANTALRELGRFMAEPREHATVQPPVRQIAEGGISVTNLSLRYSGNFRPALQDVSFTLPSQGTFALVGRNGSGKTSLIRILLGFERGFSGKVILGGHDLRHYDPRSLRAQIGIVDQDTTLFSGTIRQNIISGTANATDPQIRSSLAFADALNFVDEMPNGLDTELDEHGRNLSGGQRQRLAIARAVIRNPRLVFLDEPTAFLDAEAATALEKRLTIWGQGRLLILITHNLAAARIADAILVLDQGQLVGFGSHVNLMRECRAYATLWSDYARFINSEDRPSDRRAGS